MKKSILIKYIKSEISSSEKDEVLNWASKDKANEMYIARLKNLYISQNMPQEEATEEEVNKILNAINNPFATKRVNQKNKYFTINKKYFLISASVILLVLVSSLFTLNLHRKESKEETLLSEGVFKAVRYKNITPSKTLYTPKGVKARLLLPDSSQVWLNSDTWIEYPDRFDSSVRTVTISGEAYFSVAKNPDWPMIIKTTKGFSIQVLGTEFNIRAYENDNRAQTTLYSGEINLLREKDNKIVSTKVTPNETVIINTDPNGINISKVVKETPSDDSAWKDGKIIFDATPVSEVIKTLERWHGVEFIVKDPDILNYKITATFNSESIVQIMDLIQMTSLIKYEVQNRKVVLRKKY